MRVAETNVCSAADLLIAIADLTYIRIECGLCYLTAILDACSCKVVGYAISRRIDTPFALVDLRAALQGRNPPEGCIHHMDRSCQYASEAYRAALQEAGLRGSMSSLGNPYHNAQAESFMKTLNVEEVYIAGYETFADVATRLPRFIEEVYNAWLVVTTRIDKHKTWTLTQLQILQHRYAVSTQSLRPVV